MWSGRCTDGKLQTSKLQCMIVCQKLCTASIRMLDGQRAQLTLDFWLNWLLMVTGKIRTFWTANLYSYLGLTGLEYPCLALSNALCWKDVLYYQILPRTSSRKSCKLLLAHFLLLLGKFAMKVYHHFHVDIHVTKHLHLWPRFQCLSDFYDSKLLSIWANGYYQVQF